MKKTVFILTVVMGMTSCIKSTQTSDNRNESFQNDNYQATASNVKDTIVYNGIKCYVKKRDADHAYVVTAEKVKNTDLLPIADSLKIDAIEIEYFLPNDSDDAWATLLGRENLFLYDSRGFITSMLKLTSEGRVSEEPRNMSSEADYLFSETRKIIEDENKCRVMAESFVKKRTISPRSTKFSGGFVHEPQGSDKVKVLGKFTTKNAYGVELEYHYRMWLKFNGGDWADELNWEVLSFEYE